MKTSKSIIKICLPTLINRTELAVSNHCAEEELRLRGGLGVGEVGRGVPGGSGGSGEV